MRYGKFLVVAGLVLVSCWVLPGKAFAQTDTPTPTLEPFCEAFPSDPTCITPTPTLPVSPTASPSAVITPVYIDIASSSAFAQGMHDIEVFQFNFFLIIIIAAGIIIGAMYFFLS